MAALLGQREIESVCKGLLEHVLILRCLVMAGLAEQYDVTRCVGLYRVRKAQSVKMRHCLEPCEFFRCSACRADIFPIVKVKVCVVKFFASLKLGLAIFLLVLEVKLDFNGVLADEIAVPLVYIPHGLLLVAVEDVSSFLIKDLTVVVLHVIDLCSPPFLFLGIPRIVGLFALCLDFPVSIHEFLLLVQVVSK
jgi:hypothetical protein